MDFHIVDFNCVSAKFVVELYRGQYFDPGGQLKDAARDRALAELGLYVLRIDSLQVLKELDSVVARIDEVVGQRVDSLYIISLAENPEYTTP